MVSFTKKGKAGKAAREAEAEQREEENQRDLLRAQEQAQEKLRKIKAEATARQQDPQANAGRATEFTGGWSLAANEIVPESAETTYSNWGAAVAARCPEWAISIHAVSPATEPPSRGPASDMTAQSSRDASLPADRAEWVISLAVETPTGSEPPSTLDSRQNAGGSGTQGTK